MNKRPDFGLCKLKHKVLTSHQGKHRKHFEGRPQNA